MRPVLDLPTRLERLPSSIRKGWPPSGWTLLTFACPEDAAAFFVKYQSCAMPCWKRLDVIDGRLVQVR